jgi:hypothetical protein
MSEPQSNGERNGRWQVNTHINIGTLIQTLVIVVGGLWAVFQVENTLNEKVAELGGHLAAFEQSVTRELQELRADIRQEAARMDRIQSQEKTGQ